MAESGERLARLRRADSELKVARVLAIIDTMVDTGETLAVAAIARRAKVSRRFVYDHPELRAEIERRSTEVADRFTGQVAASARVTTASLRADLENAKARNRRLETEMAILRRRLGELLGEDAMSDLNGVRPNAADVDAKITDLEQALFVAREDLAHRSEELAAARQINRELMARLNRGA